MMTSQIKVKLLSLTCMRALYAPILPLHKIVGCWPQGLMIMEWSCIVQKGMERKEGSEPKASVNQGERDEKKIF